MPLFSHIASPIAKSPDPAALISINAKRPGKGYA
jgi:hypothetical protein